MTNPNESNEQALIELSKRVAEKLGIEADKYYKYYHAPKIEEVIWLHEDSKRCFELMCEYGLQVQAGDDNALVRDKYEQPTAVDYHDFDFDGDDKYTQKQQATRVAILKALEAL